MSTARTLVFAGLLLLSSHLTTDQAGKYALVLGFTAVIVTLFSYITKDHK